jgi:hypothetical protein
MYYVGARAGCWLVGGAGCGWQKKSIISFKITHVDTAPATISRGEEWYPINRRQMRIPLFLPTGCHPAFSQGGFSASIFATCPGAQ